MNYRKDKIIEETKELAAASRMNTEKDEVIILERTFVVQPKVFDPRIFFSTAWFAENVARLVKGEADFCEIGCGTGAVTIISLLENQTLEAVVGDVNSYAVVNTNENAKFHKVKDRLNVLESDVFDNFPKSKKYDSIFWAMPFGYMEADEQVDLIDLQTFDPGYRAIRKFFETARQYLKPNGRLLVGFSREIGTEELLEQLVKENKFSMKLLCEEQGTEKSTVTMQIWEMK